MEKKTAPRPAATLTEVEFDAKLTVSMLRLPKWIRPIKTMLSGYANPEEQPLFKVTWKSWLALYFTGLLLSLGATFVASLHRALWPMLPVFWMLTTGFMRAAGTTLIHHASHDNLTENEVRDRLLADALGILFWLPPFAKYFQDHRKGHHPYLSTDKDPDLRWIREQGFLPGRTRAYYWRHLVWLMANPVFHFRYVLSRLQANLAYGSAGRRLAFTASLLVYGLLFRLGLGKELLVVWLIPMLPFYSIAGLLQNLTEHNWVRQEGRLQMMTVDRYFGVTVPPDDAGAWRWAVWILGMTVQGLIRHFVVPFDLANHRPHHLNQKSDWKHHAYARMQEARKNPASWQGAETWGMRQALDRTFSALSALPASAHLGFPDTY